MASKNITLAMDETVLADMKVVAFQQGTSVNAIIRELCEKHVAKERAKDTARAALLSLIDESKGRMGRVEGEDKRFRREDTYSGEPRFDRFSASKS